MVLVTYARRSFTKMPRTPQGHATILHRFRCFFLYSFLFQGSGNRALPYAGCCSTPPPVNNNLMPSLRDLRPDLVASSGWKTAIDPESLWQQDLTSYSSAAVRFFHPSSCLLEGRRRPGWTSAAGSGPSVHNRERLLPSKVF